MIRKDGKEDKAETNKNKTVFGFLSAFLVILEFLSAGFGVLLLYRMNVLVTWQLLIVAAVVTLLSLVLAVFLLRRKTLKLVKIIAAVILLIMTVGFGAIDYYLAKTVDFLEKATNEINYETQEYSVFVKRTSEANGIADVAGQKIGLQQLNPYYENVREKLAETITFQAETFADLDAMLEAVMDGKIAAVVLPSSYAETLEDEGHSVTDGFKTSSGEAGEAELREIYRFEIQFEKEAVEVRDIDVSTEPFIIYISGSDSRGILSDRGRSDVNMLAVVNPVQHKILLVSIPRDYYVQLHGTTGVKDKLTHAGIYGVNMSKTTLEDLFGTQIDHTVKLGFHAVENVVNKLGGIEINSDKVFTARANKKCSFVEGRQSVDGACALAFARERKAYSTGDRHRVQNQQVVLAAIIAKATKPENIVKYAEILSALDGSFNTSLSYDEITGFARRQIQEMASWQIEAIQLDGTGSRQPTYSMGSRPLYVMIPDEGSLVSAKQKIAEYLR